MRSSTYFVVRLACDACFAISKVGGRLNFFVGGVPTTRFEGTPHSPPTRGQGLLHTPTGGRPYSPRARAWVPLALGEGMPPLHPSAQTHAVAPPGLLQTGSPYPPLGGRFHKCQRARSSFAIRGKGGTHAPAPLSKGLGAPHLPCPPSRGGHHTTPPIDQPRRAYQQVAVSLPPSLGKGRTPPTNGPTTATIPTSGQRGAHQSREGAASPHPPIDIHWPPHQQAVIGVPQGWEGGYPIPLHMAISPGLSPS